MADGIQCISIDPWIFDEPIAGYGQLLGTVVLHLAHSLALGRSRSRADIFAAMRESIALHVNRGPTLPPYTDLPIDRSDRGRELPLPPLAAKASESFEVVRAWLFDPLNCSECFVSLMPASDEGEAIGLVLRTLGLIAQTLSHKLGLNETVLYQAIGQNFVEFLKETGWDDNDDLI
jgi:hypothetical protein